MRGKAVQIRTVGFEPMFGSRCVRAMFQDQAPELWPVIHVLAMGNFMGRDIIKDMGWGQNETPIIGEIA